MSTNELLLKTVFCCMACDGDIAEEEIELVRRLSSAEPQFASIDAQSLINSWIEAINKQGQTFLKEYLQELKRSELSADEQMQIVDLAFKTIEADNKIEYSEVKFFKKIRLRLSIDDDVILAKYPDKEDFLLPDIIEADEPVWKNISFENINLNV